MSILERGLRLMRTKPSEMSEMSENCEVAGKQRPKMWHTTYGQNLWPCSHRHEEVLGKQPESWFAGRMTIDIFIFTVTPTRNKRDCRRAVTPLLKIMITIFQIRVKLQIFFASGFARIVNLAPVTC